MVTNGVSDLHFKGAIRMAARLRYDEWEYDKEFFLMRAIIRVETCMRLLKENPHWNSLRKVNVITRECELENIRHD